MALLSNSVKLGRGFIVLSLALATWSCNKIADKGPGATPDSNNDRGTVSTNSGSGETGTSTGRAAAMDTGSEATGSEEGQASGPRANKSGTRTGYIDKDTGGAGVASGTEAESSQPASGQNKTGKESSKTSSGSPNETNK